MLTQPNREFPDFSADLGRSRCRPADDVAMQSDRIGRGSDPALSTRRYYGYPEELLTGLWDIDDVCRFAKLSERKMRDLLGEPDAPPRLYMGSLRCARWNPYEVLAWWHDGSWAHLRPLTGGLEDARRDSGLNQQGDDLDPEAPAGPWTPNSPTARKGRQRRSA